MKAMLLLLPIAALTLMSNMSTTTPTTVTVTPGTMMTSDDMGDKMLADKIRAALTTDEAKAVRVEVMNRVATLKGIVSSDDVKAAVAKKVAAMKELQGVNNQLEVK